MAFGIYIHWPFCKSRCPYCDFNAHVWRVVDHARWKKAILAELRHAASEFDRKEVRTVFFGGGTPSLMEPSTVQAVLGEISALWGFGEGPEITLEANPTSSEASKFMDYAAAGVSRISVGVQALRDASLRALGRTHTAEEALDAVRIASRAVPRVSFDLIAARPDQTIRSWRSELKQALDLGTEHLSVYQLTIEPGTPFQALYDRGQLRVPDPETAANIYEATAELTNDAGLPAYEISNHARPGAGCRHNLIYWRAGDWIGIGPGAHGRPRRGGKRLASESVRDPGAWLESIDTLGHAFATAPRVLSGEEQGREYLITALRLWEGVSLRRFRALAGTAIPAEPMERLQSLGLLHRSNARIAVTARGRLVLDAILRVLLPPPPEDGILELHAPNNPAQSLNASRSA